MPDLLARRDQVINELGVLQKGATGEILQWAAEKGKKGTNLEGFIVLAGLWIRDLLALTYQAAPGQLVNQDRVTDLLSQQKEISGALILERLEALSILQRQLRVNLNIELALNKFSLHWSGASPR